MEKLIIDATATLGASLTDACKEAVDLARLTGCVVRLRYKKTTLYARQPYADAVERMEASYVFQCGGEECDLQSVVQMPGGGEKEHE